MGGDERAKLPGPFCTLKLTEATNTQGSRVQPDDHRRSTFGSFIIAMPFPSFPADRQPNIEHDDWV